MSDIRKKLAGKFISIEGIDGTGKSTQVALLANYLGAIKTREPGGTTIGNSIREILLNNHLEPKLQTILHFASRYNHVNELIIPSITNGKIVVSDRFFDSTIAYQHYGFGVSYEWIMNLQKLTIGNFAPNITFILIMPLELIAERIIERNMLMNSFDKLPIELYKKIQNGFIEIANKNERCHIIDASRGIDEVFSKIVDKLLSY